ncbi:Z-ring formation inhibitor MciZ [Bacillus massilinigeriensis]|nr:Z-ring formation inhibitor MciZ [Bacillus massilionigeriensis]
MKIYVHDKGIILVGKAWEVRQKLKENLQYYTLLKDWTKAVSCKD